MSTTNSLHPLFVSLFAGLGMPQSQATLDTARRDLYVQALQRMDWTFEDSDDHGVWMRGRDALEALRAEQRTIDPDGALWRQYAHPDFRVML